AALGVREVPRRRPHADDADEISRRDDGDRADLQGVAAEGVAEPGDRTLRPGLRPQRPLGYIPAAAARRHRKIPGNAERRTELAHSLRPEGRLEHRGHPPAHTD